MALTPMIDVVFLLLVFFMLAARFGLDSALTVSSGAPSGDYSGPPRLVTVGQDIIKLNGIEQSQETLASALRPLMTSVDDPIVLRPDKDASLQALVDVMGALSAVGLMNLVVVE